MAKTATAKKPDIVKPAPAAAGPVCETCPFFAPRAVHGALCKRFPQPVLKSAQDWCGEHPALRALQALDTPQMVKIGKPVP